MSYLEALEDGIPFSKGHSKGMNMYYPPCHVCGEPVRTLSYIRGNKYTCKACKLENYLSDKERRAVSDWEAKERKFQNAIKRISSMKKPQEDYSVAFEKIHEKIHHEGWFDSTEEIMVAIELVKRKVPARHQVKLGRYRTDFLLPSEKIILEVDGTLFHQNATERENLRDNLITLALGPEWEVVRISDKLINQNIRRLVPAVRGAAKKRRQVRAQNNGELPDWYSKHK